nr:hypothetical protein [Richelia intracellularis]
MGDEIMSEAENPNHKAVNESLNALNSPLSKQVCPFYYVKFQQPMVNSQQPPALGMNDDNEPLTIDISANKGISKTCWFVETDREKQGLSDGESQKSLELNTKLCGEDNDLYQQLKELKQALANTEESLQLQKKRSCITESLFVQQTQELSVAQNQIKTLCTDLDMAVEAVQNAKRQEDLARNYKMHLELSQQRLAQLERECTTMQANYDEQSHQLLQSENNCRELRARLMRQQRQTLQFKAALEKCLDVSVPTTDFLEDINSEVFEHNTNISQLAKTLLFHTQPIQPWSANTESVADDLEHTWEELYLSSDEGRVETTPVQSLHSYCETTLSSSVFEECPAEDSKSNIVSENNIIGNQAWGEKLDFAIQTLLEHQNPSNLSASEIEAITSLESNSSSTYNIHLSPEYEERSDAQSIVEAREMRKSILPAIENADNYSVTTIVEPSELPITEDYWSDVPLVSPSDVLGNSNSDNSWNNYDEEKVSPSPVVYPQRPPKGRKSFASVELPNFPS